MALFDYVAIPQNPRDSTSINMISHSWKTVLWLPIYFDGVTFLYKSTVESGYWQAQNQHSLHEIYGQLRLSPVQWDDELPDPRAHIPWGGQS